MRKHYLLGAVLAAAVIATSSATALADDKEAEFDATGSVGYVWFSRDPGSATSSTSSISFGNRHKRAKVEVTTTNEMVIGTIASVQSCSGPGCDEMRAALDGGSFSSLHESVAKMRVTGIDTRHFTLPTPHGELPLVAEVISGTLRGKLKGEVLITNGDRRLLGYSDLAIRGTATYACFSPFLANMACERLFRARCIPAPSARESSSQSNST